jgi:hypothetical protein
MRLIVRFSLRETEGSRLPSTLRKILLDSGLQNSGAGTFEGDLTQAEIHESLGRFWQTAHTWSDDLAYVQHFWMYADQKEEIE